MPVRRSYAYAQRSLQESAWRGTLRIHSCSRKPERLKRTAATSGWAALNARELVHEGSLHANPSIQIYGLIIADKRIFKAVILLFSTFLRT